MGPPEVVEVGGGSGGWWRMHLHYPPLSSTNLHQPPPSALSSPRCPVGIRVRRQTLGLHRDAVARRGGRHVMAIANHDGVHKMLVQVIHVLDDAILERPTDADVVEDRKVLHVLAQPHAAGM